MPRWDRSTVRGECPTSRSDELACFLGLLDSVPDRVPLLHYGQGLPRWFADAAGTSSVEGRFVDLQRRVRGSAVYPGPVFGMAEHVEYALRRDPHRQGEADAAAMWAEREEGRSWLLKKGCSDLEDLCGLAAIAQDLDDDVDDEMDDEGDDEGEKGGRVAEVGG